jgi:hypothetical protein
MDAQWCILDLYDLKHQHACNLTKIWWEGDCIYQSFKQKTCLMQYSGFVTITRDLQRGYSGMTSQIEYFSV